MVLVCTDVFFVDGLEEVVILGNGECDLHERSPQRPASALRHADPASPFAAFADARLASRERQHPLVHAGSPSGLWTLLEPGDVSELRRDDLGQELPRALDLRNHIGEARRPGLVDQLLRRRAELERISHP